MPTEESVIVVGAGIAGLAAAARLFEAGYEEVVVLEASSRIGGRIHSVNFNGNEIELGAQWIHGEEDNQLYDIAEAMGLTEKPGATTLEDLDADFFDEDGHRWDEDLIDKLQEIEDEAGEQEDDHEFEVREGLAEMLIWIL